LADASRDAEKIRGEGDATATGIYAKAYGKDIEFYSLYRSLNAYKTTFANKGDILVIEPTSEFFKYFK
jgi:membrane protease subunit HflC